MRGYKRNTSGFLLINENTPYTDSGDEAKQHKQMNKDLIVALDEDRRNGIEQLQACTPNLDCIIMDDGFQNRRVKPGFSIVLRDYHELKSNNFVAPAGTLREPLSGSKRADVIIVSKCPPNLSKNEKHMLTKQLNSTENQAIYFTQVVYDDITSYNLSDTIANISDYNIVLFTGIGNAAPLVEHLKLNAKSVLHVDFNDHHNFNANDLKNIKNKFDAIDSNKKIMLTTQKDLCRLSQDILTEMNIYFIPIFIKFHNESSAEFIEQISNFVSKPTN